MNLAMADAVLVTGVTIGFGEEIALALAGRGFVVYAGISHATQAEQLCAAAAARGVALQPLVLDVRDQGSVDAGIRTILTQNGSIYGVVHNDFLFMRAYFEDFADEEIRDVYESSLFGTMAVTRAALPAMRAAGRGRIVVISSVAGRIAPATGTAYSSVRFAQEGFAEALSQEVRPFGIYVSLIESGVVRADSWTVENSAAAAARDRGSPYYARFQQADRAFGRMLERSVIRQEEIAGKVCMAMTARRPRLRYITGGRARIAIALRRYLPDGLFEWIFFRTTRAAHM